MFRDGECHCKFEWFRADKFDWLGCRICVKE